MVGPGRFFRSEVLAAPALGVFQGVFDPARRSDISRLGIRTVIDLRADREVENTPSAWRDATGADVGGPADRAGLRGH